MQTPRLCIVKKRADAHCANRAALRSHAPGGHTHRAERRDRGHCGALSSLVLVGLIGVLCFAGSCSGPTAGDEASVARSGSGGQVNVTLETFGVGNAYRPGEVTGIRLQLLVPPNANLDQATPVWVQWDVPNADGDIVEYGRSLTLTKGVPARVWLYAPLMPEVGPSTVWSVRVFEYQDATRGTEIGGVRIRPGDANAQRIDRIHSKIAVVGQRSMGLMQYQSILPDFQVNRSPASHEQARVITGIQPTSLPDRWDALRGFEVVAWSDALPQDLPADQADALRRYIERGGHLVISLPQAGNPWGLGAAGQTYLDDLLPPEPPRKDTSVMVSDIAPIMSKARGVKTDYELSIRVFQDLNGSFNALGDHYEPLQALPDGRAVTVQRRFGHGRVTVTGIDLSSQRLYSVPLSNGTNGLPQADVFWNRILSRRADTPTGAELKAALDNDRLNQTQTENNLGSGALIAEQIQMRRTAASGLLLALVIFAAYWIIAGPGGFAMLKLYGVLKHAWIAFAGAAMLFTFVALGSVTLVRQNDATVRHVTFLDHIAQPLSAPRASATGQRAVSWMSVFLPGYGPTPVFLDADPDTRDLLYSWHPPNQLAQPFPNASRFRVDVGNEPARQQRYETRNDSSFARPARATATVMKADWLGAVDPDTWDMIGVAPDTEIEVRTNAVGQEIGLSGLLRHNLPGELRDVKIIWIQNQRNSRRQYAMREDQEAPWLPPGGLASGQLPNRGHMWALGSNWGPGQTLDLSDETFATSARTMLRRNIQRQYIDPYDDSMLGGVSGGGALTQNDQRNYMEMLSLYHMLEPPKYLKHAETNDERTLAAYREIGRSIDLSGWFNRPCVIIMGYLENSPLPLPLRVNGEAPESEGLTIVRWIYPLPVKTSIAFEHVLADEQANNNDTKQ